MHQEQMTNDADRESLRVTRDNDGNRVIEWCPCDEDGYPTDFGWVEIARIDANGSRWYSDSQDGGTWTDARTATINDLLRMVG